MRKIRSINIKVTIALCALALAGCSKSSPSASNFQAAIQRRFDTHDPKCMLYTNYPHDITSLDFGNGTDESHVLAQMGHALAHAGLFSLTVYKVQPAQKASPIWAAHPAWTLYNYKLTAMGKHYWAKYSGIEGGGCFGFKREVVAITNYTKEDSSHYGVDFTYKYIVPVWAKQPKIINVASSHPSDFQRYSEYLKSHEKPIKKTADLTLTHNGWRAEFMDMRF